MSFSEFPFSDDFFQPDLLRHNSLFECLREDIKHENCVLDDFECRCNYSCRGLCVTELMHSRADIHQVVKGTRETFLHLAVKRALIDVVKLLIEKGININAQDCAGSTALHSSCDDADCGHVMELVPMLLYHGANPCIRDNNDDTPLDIIVRKFRYPDTCSTTIEHLFRYVFYENETFNIHVDTLLKIATSEVSFFYEMIENISVDVSHCNSTTAIHLFAILPEYLEVLIEKFDWLLRHVLETEEPYFWNLIQCFRYESFCVLLSSNLQPECSNWLCKFSGKYRLMSLIILSTIPDSVKENLICYLLSYGITASTYTLELVKIFCGYNTLCKLLLHLDLEEEGPGFELTDVMTLLLYDVAGDIQTSVEDPRFWARKLKDTYAGYTEIGIEDVLPYYALPKLKESLNLEWQDDIWRKIRDQPQIPLLVELARNVFRRYFVQKFEIKSAKRFYNLLSALPIAAHYKKIITLEAQLY